MEILSKIFGSSARVKIMRLFLLNKNQGFTVKEVSKRSRATLGLCQKELRLLKSINFIKKRGREWSFDPAFKYPRETEGLLITAETISNETLVKTFKSTGRIKLLVISGIFIKNLDSRVDILIVGDRIKKNRVDEGVRKLEAEIGMELSYAVFDTKEFIYRVNMYDKLVRDILDFPHEVLLQAKELSTQTLKKA